MLLAGVGRAGSARNGHLARTSRPRLRLRLGVLAALAVALLLALAGQALAEGITNSGDDLRDGWYPEESSLTPQLVSGGTFGQLWSTSLEGEVYAQPLLYDGTLLVATEDNKVYGLNPTTGALEWPAPLNLGVPWNPADISCGDLTPTIGVTATPVIDPNTGIAYLTHKTYASGSSGAASWYMDAIDMETGKEEPGFPVLLGGNAQNQPSQSFNATTQLQRPGLLLMNGVVYAAFGSDCDTPPWQGWVFGVSSAGKVTARWVSVASGSGGGIWQSGAGLTSDGPETILLSTGNGGSPSTPAPGKQPPASLGDSIVRLDVQPNGTLKAVDFFTPFDAASLDAYDEDFASGGVTALDEQYFGTASDPKLAVAVGKDGYVYLLNRESLGGFMQGPGEGDDVVQRIGPYGGVWSRPGVWPGEGGWVYIPTASGGNSAGGSSGFLNVYQYGVSGSGQPNLSLQGTSSEPFGFGSSAPVITSNGTTSGSALVWVVWSPGGGGEGAQLRAYDPVPVDGRPVLRWSAPVGTASKFLAPGVGAGRLYVGNREGKLLAFGSPVTPPLTGAATTFPATTLSSSSQATLTLTATTSLTLTKLVSSSTQFSVGTPSPALPAALSAGQSIKLPLEFTPTETGLIGATLTAETSAGSASFALSGTGETAGPQLESTPTLLSFGGTTVGTELAGAATFRNVGGAPLTIEGVKLPQAPFSASGVPAVGSQIAPGGSIAIDLAFRPTAAGNFAGEIELETTGGDSTVGLSGSAGAAGVLKYSSEQLEYKNVKVGATETKSFKITNTGGTTVEITKSKPPSGGAFGASTSLAEGTTIAPGHSVTEKVVFAPDAPGYASAVWTINGDDVTGLREIRFNGTGTVPAPGPAWSHNGSATIADGNVRTTTATPYQAGSAFFQTPLESRHLTVEFEQTIGGGTGADGQTVTFADASQATPQSLGADGGGLGFAGIPGVAVAFDTYKNAVNPSNNFVGVSNGPGSEAGLLSWLFTDTPTVNLRSGKHKIEVELLEGTITVWIDGTQALSGQVSVAPRVLLGFTGGTGMLDDLHSAAHVAITGTPAPPPATLEISSTVVAKAGSSQAATELSYSGTCPSSFTTAPLAGGGSSTPTLAGAVAGANCRVSQQAPSGGGWSTTVSIDGAAPVALEASGGELAVPEFALSAGKNTLQFVNTYLPAIPDPSAGGWQLNGTATQEGAELALTQAKDEQAGSAFWPHAIDPQDMTVEFEESIGGGSGADGLALVFADAGEGATPTSLGAPGGGLGFSGIPGIAVALDTYQNAVNPSNNFVGISNGPAGAPDLLHWLATATVAPALHGASHHVKVIVEGGRLTVLLDGVQVLGEAVTLPTNAYLGFTGGTGGLTDRHAISHLLVAAGG